MPKWSGRDAIRMTNFLDPGEWACSQDAYGCEPTDVEAARYLRRDVRRGEALLSNLEYSRAIATLHANAVVSTFAGIYIRGAGIRISPDDRFAMDMYMEPIGFRARAFWAMLRMEILDHLKVDYLYVDPARLDAERMTRIGSSPRLTLVRRFDAHGETREIYRVRREPPPSSAVPAGVVVERLTMPESVRPAHMYTIPMTVGFSAGERHDGMPMFYRLTLTARS